MILLAGRDKVNEIGRDVANNAALDINVPSLQVNEDEKEELIATMH